MNEIKSRRVLAVIADLKAEYESLDGVLALLHDAEWDRSTLFRDWTVFDTVAHLLISERIGLAALTDPASFARQAEAQMRAHREAQVPLPDWRKTALPELGVGDGAALRALWSSEAQRVATLLTEVPQDMRVPWYGPSMSVASFATARLMETWAHGETIHDALAMRRPATSRLRHVCDLGWRTRSYALTSHGLPQEDAPVYVALRAPGDESWTWGDAGAVDKISGCARDFARVVCQCRNVLDTGLVVVGPAATRWMAVAQCFAGGAVAPPPPGVRKTAADEAGIP
jgi:uncharacterized protein (TIGR03084 family)